MNSSPHGGVRPGAGRKPGSGVYGEPTVPIRVPRSEVDTIVSYLDAHRQDTQAVGPRPISMQPSVIHLVAFASRVAAGFPSPATDYIDDAIDLNAELIIPGHEASTFVLRVKGWSMHNAGIFDGDRIVVDRALDPMQGDVVVAILNNDLTIKSLGKIDGRLALIPENPHFPPIVMKDGDELLIWGVVTNCLRSFRRSGR